MYLFRYVKLLTIATLSISSVAWLAWAGIAPRSVGTLRILITAAGAILTLISIYNIWNKVHLVLYTCTNVSSHQSMSLHLHCIQVYTDTQNSQWCWYSLHLHGTHLDHIHWHLITKEYNHNNSEAKSVDLFHTSTTVSVPGKANRTHTSGATSTVCTLCILMAWRCANHCMWVEFLITWYAMTGTTLLITTASPAVSSVARQTSAVVAPNSIGTVCILITAVSILALINIY